MQFKTFFLTVIISTIIYSCGKSPIIKNNYIYSNWHLKPKNEADVLENKDKIKKLTIEYYTHDTFPTSAISKLSKVKEITVFSEDIWKDDKYDKNLVIDKERLSKLTQLSIGTWSGFSMATFPTDINVLHKIEKMSLDINRYESIDTDLTPLQNLKWLNIQNDDLLTISQACKFPKTLKRLIINGSKLQLFSKESISETKNLEIEISSIGANTDDKIQMTKGLLNAENLKKLKLYVKTCEEKNYILNKIANNKALSKLKIINTEKCKEHLYD